MCKKIQNFTHPNAQPLSSIWLILKFFLQRIQYLKPCEIIGIFMVIMNQKNYKITSPKSWANYNINPKWHFA